MQILLHTAQWENSQYELIDSGYGYKLERFGCNVLMRPEPQALWSTDMNEKEWESLLSARFERKGRDGDSGNWTIKKGAREQWTIRRKMEYGEMVLRLGLTSFKHVGVFAEQGANWDYIQQRVAEKPNCKVLNMFAYTGAASIAAALAGGEVTHLDSVKAVNVWAKENAELSGLQNVRFITDDALTFASRELRRDRVYDGIILDPPAYGRGTDGQKWVLEEHIYDMLEMCEKLLSKEKGSFLLLSLYSMGFSALLARTLVSQIFGKNIDIEFSELYQKDSFGKDLPLGLSIRLVRF